MNLCCARPFLKPSTLLWLLLTLFTSLAFIGCGSGSGPVQGDGTSGVQGIVTTRFGTLNNTSVPVANALVSIHDPPPSPQSGLGVPIVPGSGKLLAQGQTDAQGRYSLAIRPGNYQVVARQQVQSGSGALGVQSLTVQAHQFTSLDVPLTTGPSQ